MSAAVALAVAITLSVDTLRRKELAARKRLEAYCACNEAACKCDRSMAANWYNSVT